jgi:AbrB family looped-hinge helix DNA binding protein
MLIKVHPKGQIVIPATVRKQLGIEIGDVLEVELVPEEGKIELRRAAQRTAESLAGSLEHYASGRSFPSERSISKAFQRGLLGDG